MRVINIIIFIVRAILGYYFPSNINHLKNKKCKQGFRDHWIHVESAIKSVLLKVRYQAVFTISVFSAYKNGLRYKLMINKTENSCPLCKRRFRTI